MNDTRTRLIRAALATVRENGLSAASARVIAGRAGVNQALVFYHFHTVSELLEAASDQAVEDSIDHYREAFAAAESLTDLLGVGREVHRRERRTGNVVLMAQLMSGAQGDPVLARATRRALAAWTREIRTVVDRVLAGSAVGDVVDAEGLAHAIAAGFVGLELYDGIDSPGALRALDALEDLGRLVDVVQDLGPVARRALRRRVGR